MKKIQLIFSTLIVGVNPLLTISCNGISKDNIKEIENDPIPPNYNLVEYLKEINELEFHRQYQDLSLNDWTFENSWFDIFETDSSLMKIEYLSKNEESEVKEIILKRKTFLNDCDSEVTWVTPSFKINIPYDENTKLFSTDIKLNINQDFYITEPNLKFYQYNLEKNSIVNTQISDDYEIISKKIKVPPHKLAIFYTKLQLLMYKSDVNLNFKMRDNTTILTKIQNKNTNETKFMHYSFETLLKEMKNNNDYLKIFENKNGLLRKNEKKSLEVNLQGRLEMIKEWKIIQGEEDGN